MRGKLTSHNDEQGGKIPKSPKILTVKTTTTTTTHTHTHTHTPKHAIRITIIQDSVYFVK